MTKHFLILAFLQHAAFAGTPETPCRSTSGMKVSRNSIDAILNSPGRINSDFIGPVEEVNIPGLPKVPDQYLPNIVTNGWRADGDISLAEGQYHLFNPVPDRFLRDLAPDRPDATESPITVDPGRFQIEASLFDYRRDQGVETFTYGQLNLKAGLTHNIDLQAVINLRSESAGEWTTFGDLTMRLKYNLWGNKGEDTALAIMPYVTAPTRSDDWQGGIIVPWSTALTPDISLGFMGQLDFVNDGTGSETEFLFTAVLGYPLIGKLGGYSEYIGVIAEDRYESYYSGGLTYEINENLVLDAGVQIGLNSDSEDFGCFTGFTKRF